MTWMAGSQFFFFLAPIMRMFILFWPRGSGGGETGKRRGALLYVCFSGGRPPRNSALCRGLCWPPPRASLLVFAALDRARLADLGLAPVAAATFGSRGWLLNSVLGQRVTPRQARARGGQAGNQPTTVLLCDPPVWSPDASRGKPDPAADPSTFYCTISHTV